MKRTGANNDPFIYHLSTRERDALIRILQTYPVVPPAHHRVSKELKDSHVAEYQHLLEEALAGQRDANKRHLHEWLVAPERFQKSKTGYRFTLEHADSEWFLQVLNDIRVGHWLRLGSPEPGELKPEHLDSTLLPAWVAMEMSGYFQMTLLEGLQS